MSNKMIENVPWLEEQGQNIDFMRMMMDDEDDDDSLESLLKNITRNHMAMAEDEMISPDTYGCNCLFLRHFVNEDMSDDMAMIARDFLSHEYQNIEKYQEIYYGFAEALSSPPDYVFESQVLDLMFNAYKAGSAFAKAQFQYLYKKYYKREYNQFKRFKKLCMQDVFELSREKGGGMDELRSLVTMARILSMAEICDIEINMDCIGIYVFMDDFEDRLEDEEDKWDEEPEIEPKYLDKAERIIRNLIGDEEVLAEEIEESNDILISLCLYFGFSAEYIMKNEFVIDVFETYQKAVAVYIETVNKKRYTVYEIHLAVALYRIMSVYADDLRAMESKIEDLLGASEDPYKPMYEPGKVQVPGQKAQKQEEKQENPKPLYKEDALLKEIESLQNKVHQLERNEKSYRNTIKEKDSRIKELENQLQKQEGEHEELIALRDHVYNMTESDISGKKVSVREMKQAVIDKRIIIIGGHDKWLNKMKQEFPGWTFLPASLSGTLDPKIVKGADKVYFFTDTMAHSVYYRHMQVIREHKVSFGYIHGTNIDMNIEQIYRDLGK